MILGCQTDFISGTEKMKALIIYAIFVVVGGTISVFTGLFVEREVSSAISLIVFLSMFFANFAVAWILTILVMDGSLKNAQGRQDQMDIEKAGQASMLAARTESDALRTAAAHAKSA
jgi:hypothetical protein